jgi:hypothetical protein
METLHFDYENDAEQNNPKLESNNMTTSKIINLCFIKFIKNINFYYIIDELQAVT